MSLWSCGHVMSWEKYNIKPGRVVTYVEVPPPITKSQIRLSYFHDTWHSGDLELGAPTQKIIRHLSQNYIMSYDKLETFHRHSHKTYEHQFWQSGGLGWGASTYHATCGITRVVNKGDKLSPVKPYDPFLVWSREITSQIKNFVSLLPTNFQGSMFRIRAPG